jgi:cbb3-type cytochrome oxidase maturation protein
METVYFLVPLAAVLALLVVAALVWAVRSGQFDDLEGPAQRILMEEEWSDPPPPAGTRTGGGSEDRVT